MAEIIPFDFEGNSIRSTVINDEPWFVATDVCQVLGIKNPSDTVSKVLDDDESGVATIYTSSGDQNLLTVNESGLYSLIFKSRKAAARRFRKWVTAEVLPAIRKTGHYGTAESGNEHTVSMRFADYSKLLNQQTRLIEFLDRESHTTKQHQLYGVVRNLFERTALTDEEIAHGLVDSLGYYCPEWVAWRRREETETNYH